MSYAEDFGYDMYDGDEIASMQRTQEVTLRGGEKKRMCNECKGYNVKKSSKGNWYCADLCWVDKAEES